MLLLLWCWPQSETKCVQLFACLASAAAAAAAVTRGEIRIVPFGLQSMCDRCDLPERAKQNKKKYCAIPSAAEVASSILFAPHLRLIVLLFCVSVDL